MAAVAAAAALAAGVTAPMTRCMPRSAAWNGRRERPSRCAIADTSTRGTSLSNAIGAKAAINKIATPLTAALGLLTSWRALPPRQSAPTITGFASISATSTSMRRFAQCAVAGQTKPASASGIKNTASSMAVARSTSSSQMARAPKSTSRLSAAANGPSAMVETIPTPISVARTFCRLGSTNCWTVDANWSVNCKPVLVSSTTAPPASIDIGK